MEGKDNFLTFFKVPVLVSSFGGVPVPGAENLLIFSNTFRKIFKFISYYGVIMMITHYIDKFQVALYDVQYSKWKYFIIGGMSMVFCGLLRNLYMIIRQKEWSGIIEQYDASFRKALYSDIRRAELRYEKEFVLKIVKWEYVVMVSPVVLWSLTPIVTGKQGMSSFLPWDHDNSPTFEITAIYNFFYAYFVTLTWTANDSFLMIYMSLVATELRYLTTSLKKLLGDLRSCDHGIVYLSGTAVEDVRDQNKMLYEKKMIEIKSQLDVWVFHHAGLISFSTRLQKFYSPMVLLEYLFFVEFVCFMLYYAASGVLTPIYFIIALSLPCCHGLALYVLCWFGERISSQNEQLSQEIFHQDWFLLPKDIQYSLRFIIMRAQKRLGLSAFSIVPLNIKTFDQIMKWSYSFFMFIKDTNRITAKPLN